MLTVSKHCLCDIPELVLALKDFKVLVFLATMPPKKDPKDKKVPKAKQQRLPSADADADTNHEGEDLSAKQLKVQQTLFGQVCASADATADQKTALEHYKYNS